jgi:hypothetical protein
VALRLGLSYVQRHWPGPLALVETGASAGLNLLLDRYGYRVGGQEASPAAASPVTITCEVTGASQALGEIPKITSRLGIDRYPIDLTHPGVRAWPEAFVWPELTDDLTALRGAIDLALTLGTAPVVPGDATTDTLIPSDGPLARRNSLYLVGAARYDSGHRDSALPALADPYLRRLAVARHEADDFAWL